MNSLGAIHGRQKYVFLVRKSELIHMYPLKLQAIIWETLDVKAGKILMGLGMLLRIPWLILAVKIEQWFIGV